MTSNPMMLPALFGQMGNWKYYNTLMTMADLDRTVSFATQINEIREGKQLSDLIQRALTDGRAKDIASYIAGNDDRFFNALVIAVYGGDPEWLEFSINPSGRNKQFSLAPQWATNAFGFLRLSGDEKLFPLDGQHRLAGIKEALARKTDLGIERIPVIFVSHHTDDDGRKRTRKLFATLNRSAVPVNKSEIIALDESDNIAIITRRLVEENKYFNDGKVLAAYGTANLSASDRLHFITIVKLYDLVAYILGYIVGRFDTRGRVKLRYVRLEDAELENAYQLVASFFARFIAEIPELEVYFSAAAPAARKILVRERYTNKNVLFRSVGLDVFLRIVREATVSNDWNAALRKARRLPRKFNDAPYLDIIYDAESNRIVGGRRRLVQNVLLYMLSVDKKPSSVLLSEYALALGVDEKKASLPPRIKLT